MIFSCIQMGGEIGAPAASSGILVTWVNWTQSQDKGAFRLRRLDLPVALTLLATIHATDDFPKLGSAQRFYFRRCPGGTNSSVLNETEHWVELQKENSEEERSDELVNIEHLPPLSTHNFASFTD